MSDPLSFFAGEDSSDSEAEGEKDEIQPPPDKDDNESSENTEDKLPSPSTLFATIGRPSFLYEEKEINWDNFVKNDVGTEQYGIHITEDGGYAAIPPPSEDTGQPTRVHTSLSAAITATYNKESAGEISAPPVRYSKPEEVDPKYRAVDEGKVGGSSTSTGEVKTGSKRTVSSEETQDVSSKKSKTETFRKKEKRKRDLGQTSRGKSYVEEEKRLLRQQFGTDEIMS